MNQRFETYEAVEDTYSHQEQNSLGYFADETSPGMIPSEFVSNQDNHKLRMVNVLCSHR